MAPSPDKQRIPHDDDIVISGIAGRFPEANNMDEFAAKLYANEDMVTCDDRRWPIDINDGLGSRTGKIRNAEKFDGTFFSMLSYLSHAMDPISRIALETTYEAFFDAGVCPHSIRGTNTGVYFGLNTIAQADGLPQDDFYDANTKEAAFWVYGTSKVLYANRISFLFDFQGPSLVIDTACSAALVALTTAVNDIRSGVCDTAVVATGNMVPAPFGNSIYSCVGLLAKDGKCKVWDKSADGFVRSETIGCIILQRRSKAKRVYADVLHAKVNSDGYKSVGLFAPYWVRQKDLMVSTYEEAGVDPENVVYFEAHGTGTNVGDPQEAKAISEAYCKDRDGPLLVGAVKSNMGHAEGSSGLNSVAKVLIAYENLLIPSNLHFQSAKREIYSIIDGLIKPVVKNTPFNGGIVGVNSFGVGGVNAHVLLKNNQKELTEESFKLIDSKMPRLVFAATRTNDGLNQMWDFIKKNPGKVHRDFLALLNESMKTDWVDSSTNFPYRGYMIMREKPDGSKQVVDTSIGKLTVPEYIFETKADECNRPIPIYLVFSGMGSQWSKMAKDMLHIKPFADSINRAAAVLTPFGIDLHDLLLSEDPDIWKKTVNAFVAITSMQIALFDLIELLDIKFDGMIGHSFGEVACAYADGCITLEQAVLTAYWRGYVVEHSKLPRGTMAAVALTWKEAKQRCPEGVVPACHNGSDSVTISGLYEPTRKFVEQLTEENVFARLVAGGEYPYHSPHMNAVASDLMAALSKVIPEPKKRSSKWVSTSFPQRQWESDAASYASAEYFTSNLVSPVLFHEGMQEMPKDAIMLEVAPHSLFDSIFKRCYTKYKYVGLMKRNEEDNLSFFLNSLGKLYILGKNFKIENLYPKVEWPVARTTQSLSSLMTWDHSVSYHVKKYPEYHNFSSASDYYSKICCQETDWQFIKDHTIEGKIIFPATGYLYLVWRRLANAVGQPWSKTPIHFENVRFHRPTLLTETSEIRFTIRYLHGSGEFLVYEGSNTVCTGIARLMESENGLEVQDTIDAAVREDRLVREKNMKNSDFTEYLSCREIYKELRIRGYDYGKKFQGLQEARCDGRIGKVQWMGHFVSFMDSLLHISLIALPIRALFVPIGFESVRIDPNILFGELQRLQEKRVDATKDGNEKAEFLYFSDKSESHNKHLEADIVKRVEAVVEESNENEEKQTDLPINFYETSNFMELGESNVAYIPVIFDHNNRSIFTKGLEVKGMIPFAIPRKIENKGLLLENYNFMPYTEEKIQTLSSTQIQDRINYLEICQYLANLLVFEKTTTPTVRDLVDDRFATLRKYYMESDMLEHSVHFKVFSLLRDLLELKLEKREDGSVFVYSSPIAESKLTADGTKISPEVLKKYDFSSDITTSILSHERILRPMLDTVLENLDDRSNLRIVEVNGSMQLLAPKVISTIKTSFVGNLSIDYSFGNTGTQIVANDMDSLALKSIEWNRQSNTFLNDSSSFDLLISRMSTSVNKDWDMTEQIKTYHKVLKDNGFLLVLARDNLTSFENQMNAMMGADSAEDVVESSNVQKFIKLAKNCHLGLVSSKSDQFGCYALLFRKLRPTFEPEKMQVLRIPSPDVNEWLEKLKTMFEENKDAGDNPKTIWLIATEPYSGVIGMVNCLRLEPGGNRVRCLFDLDKSLSSQTIDFTRAPFNEIAYFDLVFNVFRGGNWGAYRYQSLPKQVETHETEFAFLNIEQRGDLSSFKWFESEHKYFNQDAPTEQFAGSVLCDVFCSSLNFKDVMLATGRIQPGPESAIFDCVIGLEFSGKRRDTGKRVMGMVPFKGFATTVTSFDECLWPVPDSWTLEEAASIPVVYTTAYYALIVRGNVREGEKILIHSAAGGVGQAAIRICQDLKCEIFCTVGNQEKRDFIKREFGIADENIFNSRDLSFERYIKERTKGLGVDVVLNSLAEEKLQASLRCLGLNGRFLEIGKYDMQMNKPIGMFAFLQNISFHGICLDSYFREGFDSPNLKRFMKRMTELLKDGLEKGVVRPIQRTTFGWNQVEDAFRFMATGKHIGKVVIKLREEQKDINVTPPLKVIATRRTWFDPAKSYVIVGGLGGFGLELLYWMVMRGGKKFVLSSRSGFKNSYQKLYFKRLKELSNFISIFDIDITVSTSNICSEAGTRNLLQEAKQKGPVGGVFNLALVLQDAYLANQTVEGWHTVCNPKMMGLVNLDRVTRAECPQLEYFVCFSSLTSGRGNSGQINYGFANSSMERICETRRRDGLPAHAIQWGPIGDVGIVAEYFNEENSKAADMLKAFGGISLQRIASCLEVLDRFLQIDSPVLSSVIKSNLEDEDRSSEDNVINQLCTHLNVDKRAREETIGEVGIDSMTIVEIQQRLENEYQIQLTVADVKRITIGELKDFRDGNRDVLKQFSEDLKVARAHLSTIRFEWQTEPYTIVFHKANPSSVDFAKHKPVYFLPPIEGIFETLKEMISQLSVYRPVVCLNWLKKMSELGSMKKVMEYFKSLMARLEPGGQYDVIGHSFGGVVGVHMCRKYVPIRTLLCLDPFDISNVKEDFDRHDKIELVLSYLRTFLPQSLVNKLSLDVRNRKSEADVVHQIAETLKSHSSKTSNNVKDIEEIIKTSFERAEMMLKYKQKNLKKLKLVANASSRVMQVLTKIGVDIAIVKRLLVQTDMDKLEDMLLKNYGINRNDFSGNFDVYQVIGTECDFLSTHLSFIVNIIKNKLKMVEEEDN